MEESDRRRMKNRVAHLAPGSVKIKTAGSKKIVADME